jgi:hypothetical protein
MTSTSKKDRGSTDRLQIPVTKPQRAALEAAAQASSASLNTWALARLMKAASAEHTEGSPIVVSGKVADRARQLAKAQDITADELLEQLMLGHEPSPPSRGRRGA